MRFHVVLKNIAKKAQAGLQTIPKRAMVCRYLALLLTLTSFLGCITNVYGRQSVLYGGGPLYSGAFGNLDMIRSSGFTTLVIWTMHVTSDGSILLNNNLIIQNGKYVGDPNWPGLVAGFKSGVSSVSRIEVGLSSHDDSTFTNIRDLVFSQGTGTNSILYKNFQALRKVIPSINGINYDEESHIYDNNVLYTMEQFSLMLADLGFNIELDVFCCSDAWTSVFNYVNGQRPGTIDRIDLQCYAGGGGNDPCSWNTLFGGLNVTPGLYSYPSTESGGYWARTPSQVYSQMSSWNSSCNIAGGFMWYLDDMLQATNIYPVSAYADAINSALGIDPSRGIVATVYENTEYGGWSVDLGRGPYGAVDIGNAGGQIDQISSLKVSPGWQLTLYSGPNFTGNTLVKTNNDASLVNDGWNDSAQSLTVLPIHENPVTLYQNSDYWGWSAQFGLGSYTTSQIIAAGGADNSASSVIISPGYKVTFYQYDNFQGPQLVRTANDNNFVADGWNDMASSLKVSIDLTKWKPVTIYQNAAYTGWAAGFGVGTYRLSQIIAAGGRNDDASSVKIAPGYTVTFYKDDNFQGDTLVKTDDDVCFYGEGFNDVISSMLVSGPTNQAVPISLSPAGSEWKYYDQTSDLGTAWRGNGFDDASWVSGSARLGYGGNGAVTQVPNNGQWTTYFRRLFYVGDPNAISNLTASITRSDAAVVYLNGTQIWRDTNITSGVITYQTPALSALDTADATNWLALPLSSATRHLLVQGWNLLAVEIHKANLSNGIGFDFDLSGTIVLPEKPSILVNNAVAGHTLTWPGYENSFAVYAATNIAASQWTLVTNTPVLSHGAWVVTLPSETNQQRFFRLESY